MNAVMEYVDQMRTKLTKHRFFSNLRDLGLKARQVLHVSPMMSIFVMNFRDMNRWVIRFGTEKCLLENVINGSTLEDETHSRLFLEDWRKLHLDDVLSWRGGDTLWWFFLAEDTEPFRKYGVEFMRLCVDDGGDPLVRFAHSESGEACGHVFFEAVSPIAERLTTETSLRYRYFGVHHLELETGHVLKSEGVFEGQHLSHAQRELGLKLSQKMFSIFDGIHDAFNLYLTEYVFKNRVPHRERSTVRKLNAEPAAEIGVTPEVGVHESQQLLVDRLAERKSTIAAHPFYEWLLNSDVRASHKLKRFIPLWIVDIMGYRDLNKYVFKFSDSDSDADDDKKKLNLLVSDIETHSRMFIDDWDELRMDELLRWTASDCMEFLFFDSMMDVHRKNLIDFGMVGLGMKNPVERFWFLNALEASGHAFFATTRQIALRAEQEDGIVLNYLADRHSATHRSESEHAEIVADFYQHRLSAEQVARLSGIIDFVFDALTKNLDISLAAAKDNKFAVR